MDDQRPPEGADEEISYEDFDDVPPPADELDVLDLDAQDAPLKPPVSVLPPKHAKRTERAQPPAPREPATPQAEQTEHSSEDAPAAPSTAAEVAQPAEPPPPPPPDWVYYALIELPTEVGARVLELRATAGIDDMPPPGITLMGSFRTQALAAVEAELAHWARNHLPLQIEAVGVVAEVHGRQDYLAAWALQPAEELSEALEALQRTLLLLVKPLHEEKPRPHLVIGARVAAERYPHLIAQMQRDFEPFVWQAARVVLVRKDAEADAGAWEIAATYE